MNMYGRERVTGVSYLAPTPGGALEIDVVSANELALRVKELNGQMRGPPMRFAGAIMHATAGSHKYFRNCKRVKLNTYITSTSSATSSNVFPPGSRMREAWSATMGSRI